MCNFKGLTATQEAARQQAVQFMHAIVHEDGLVPMVAMAEQQAELAACVAHEAYWEGEPLKPPKQDLRKNKRHWERRIGYLADPRD